MSRPMLQVSTTDDLVANVIRLFAGAGDDTPILYGEQHLAQFDGPKRIVIVLDKDGGSVGGPSKVSRERIAGITERFVAHIWGGETVDDATRYTDVKARVMRYINALSMSAPGKIKKLSLGRPDASADTFGEQYQVSATYQWDVPRDWAIWNVPTTPQDNDDMRPEGDSGDTFTLNAPVEGSR